ncbi:MAG: dipeptidase [Chitinophagaceae bacterium]|nr:dipeptidase [Chitinophagaceae bacterium]
MIKNNVWKVVLLLSISCSPSHKNVETMSEQEIQVYAKELADALIITDGHIDLPYRMKEGNYGFGKEILDISVRTPDGDFDYFRAKEGGLDAPFMSIYIPSKYGVSDAAKFLADSLIDLVENITKKFPNQFALAKTPSEVEKNTKDGKISFPMGMENGSPIGNDLSRVEYFFKRGINYITLTHAKDNQICDSSYDTIHTHNGLSPFGEQVIQEMNKVGIMVDVSHVSDSAFYDVMKITKAPVIASHSSCRHFTPGFERNMSDEMIVELAKNGGVLQINFGSTFLSQEARDNFKKADKHLEAWMQQNNLSKTDSLTLAYKKEYYTKNNIYENVTKVADHIDHVVQLVGIDHVGLGSDFDGVGDSLPIGLKDASQYPNLIAELLKRGYSEEEIEKICSKNVWRVWNTVLQIAEKQ